MPSECYIIRPVSPRSFCQLKPYPRRSFSHQPPPPPPPPGQPIECCVPEPQTDLPRGGSQTKYAAGNRPDQAPRSVPPLPSLNSQLGFSFRSPLFRGLCRPQLRPRAPPEPHRMPLRVRPILSTYVLSIWHGQKSHIVFARHVISVSCFATTELPSL